MLKWVGLNRHWEVICLAEVLELVFTGLFPAQGHAPRIR